MNQLQQVFNFKGNQVRTILINNEPYFVAKDVCEVLGIVNHRDAVSRLSTKMKDDVGITDAIGRLQQTTVINEPGLYKMVFRSNKPEAEQFTDWIAEEVLPSIRQSGTYSIQNSISLPTNYIEALEAHLRSEKEKAFLQTQVQLMQPKADIFDVIASADNAQAMNSVAKSFGIGRNKLFEFLRDQKVLRYNNEPYQTYIDRGYFSVRQVPIARSSGYVDNKTQTLVTAKGIEYIGRLLRDHGLLQTRALAVSM